MVKIYTKSGDKGRSSLFGGQKVEKSDLRIEAYGNVDELNSQVGTIVAELYSYSSSERKRVEKFRFGSSRQARTIRVFNDLSKKLTRIQNELFVLGSDLATPLNIRIKIPRVTKSFTNRLEKEIDSWQKDLPQLKKFILPGGSKIGAKLHLARSTTRRTERSIVRLAQQNRINGKDLIYINRLSDWFFVLARFVNKLEKIKETQWRGRG